MGRASTERTDLPRFPDGMPAARRRALVRGAASTIPASPTEASGFSCPHFGPSMRNRRTAFGGYGRIKGRGASTCARPRDARCCVRSPLPPDRRRSTGRWMRSDWWDRTPPGPWRQSCRREGEPPHPGYPGEVQCGISRAWLYVSFQKGGWPWRNEDRAPARARGRRETNPQTVGRSPPRRDRCGDSGAHTARRASSRPSTSPRTGSWRSSSRSTMSW